MKTIIGFLLIASTLIGASHVSPSSVNANEQIIRKMLDAFNRHQWTEVTAFYAEQAYFLDPGLGTTDVIRSQKQIKAHHEELHQLFPDIQNEIATVVSSGNKVVVEFISSGTAPDGSRWKLPICTVFTISGDKIIRDATYYDYSTN